MLLLLLSVIERRRARELDGAPIEAQRDQRAAQSRVLNLLPARTNLI